MYYLNGNLVSDMNDDELARIRNKEIGFVFQTFNLLPRATSLHNVELPLIYAGLSADERAGAGESGAARRWTWKQRMYHKPNELSGGQRQRVASGAGAGEQSLDPAGRRADGHPGHRHRQRNHGAVRAPATSRATRSCW